MEIKLEFNEKETKILYAMMEILEKDDAKSMIESILREKWKELKRPKVIDIKNLATIGLQKFIEYKTKVR
jgi:hypothetical protein